MFYTFVYARTFGTVGEVLFWGAAIFGTQNTVKKGKEIWKILGAQPLTRNRVFSAEFGHYHDFLGKVWYDVV